MNIGLTQRQLVNNNHTYDCVEPAWCRFLKDHTLSFIPNFQDQDFSGIARGIDMLIITGGDTTPDREAVESILIAEMTVREKPIIGICHGCFLLTNHLGGTCGIISNHHNTVHYIQYREQVIMVNSFHTQCVQRIPPGATNLCISEDGSTEAWINGLIAGITWHPERMDNPWIPDEIARLFNR